MWDQHAKQNRYKDKTLRAPALKVPWITTAVAACKSACQEILQGITWAAVSDTCGRRVGARWSADHRGDQKHSSPSWVGDAAFPHHAAVITILGHCNGVRFSSYYRRVDLLCFVTVTAAPEASARRQSSCTADDVDGALRRLHLPIRCDRQRRLECVTSAPRARDVIACLVSRGDDSFVRLLLCCAVPVHIVWRGAVKKSKQNNNKGRFGDVFGCAACFA